MQQQSRVEFLAKYGLLTVVLIIIGSVISFGGILIFQERQNQCNFEFGITCVEHIITPTGITFSLQNNLGQDITIISLKDTAGNCETHDQKIRTGNTITLFLSKCQHNQTGIYKTTMELIYSTSSKTQRSVAGTVRGIIQS